MTALIIDDLRHPHPRATIGTHWELVSDQVMGGVSLGSLRRDSVQGRPALHLKGGVRLENNGGFLQAALDLAADGATFDASDCAGIALDVLGNGETYNIHLRTADVTRPWQSYRATFRASASWVTVTLPFDRFSAHRVDAPLDLSTLRRIGLVAIGRAFRADLAVAGLRFFA